MSEWMLPGFFDRSLQLTDEEIAASMVKESNRQQNQIELIASENIASRAVVEAQASLLTNKYAEGYPGRRYYQGCEFCDEIETQAIVRARRLFDCSYINVQPHSGAQANGAVMLALLHPGDTILGMSLDAGGHLTHGAKPALSGKWFNAIQYGVDPKTHLIDYDQVEALAKKHKPKMIIAGGSAYPRQIDFARFRQIADSVDAYLLVDMAHFAGLVAGGVHPNPLEYAHIVTTTTHKTLRGPRGGMILSRDDKLGKKMNSAVFPGLQGGPLMHIIAAKAVAFKEALDPSFKLYGAQVIKNAQILADSLQQKGFDIISGGTDTHVVLVDLRPKNITGKAADEALERAGMTCNKNGVPFDPQPPMITSGIRLGSPAGTTRGFGEKEFIQIADWINQVVEGLIDKGDEGDPVIEKRIKQEVADLCQNFPIYSMVSKSS